MDATRRSFLLKVGMAGAGIAAASPTALGQAAATQHAVEPLPPTEDLMREHGLIHRLLTLYEEAAGRLAAGQAVPAEALLGGFEGALDSLRKLEAMLGIEDLASFTAQP